MVFAVDFFMQLGSDEYYTALAVCVRVYALSVWHEYDDDDGEFFFLGGELFRVFERCMRVDG